MAEAARIGLDGEALPAPVGTADHYLAAIYDELRAIRLSLQPQMEAAEAPTLDEAAPEEPAPTDLPRSATAGAAEPQPRRKSAPQKRKPVRKPTSTKKPA